jgi:hypothetical protein
MSASDISAATERHIVFVPADAAFQSFHRERLDAILLVAAEDLPVAAENLPCPRVLAQTFDLTDWHSEEELDIFHAIISVEQKGVIEDWADVGEVQSTQLFAVVCEEGFEIEQLYRDTFALLWI